MIIIISRLVYKRKYFFSFMKLSLILNVIDPKIGGVMIMGEGELLKIRYIKIDLN